VCYDKNHPDLPPLDQLTLTSGDGSSFAAYLAHPASPSGARLVLLPDVSGLRPVVGDLARRLAETGALVLAIDYFGRTAGTQPRPEDFDPDPHQEVFDRDNAVSDIRAGVSYLDTLGSGPTFIAGFCMGGALALYAATFDVGLAGAIAFCPWHGAIGLSPALPDDFVSAVRCPVLGLFGEVDHAVPVAVASAFDKALAAAGVDHDIVVYPEQPHGFFERNHFGEQGHEAAAIDAFRRVTAFMARPS
jgi:carboxymethylenebutenolidase